MNHCRHFSDYSQNCISGNRSSVHVSSTNHSETINRTNGYLPVGNCFPSLFEHYNVAIEDTVSKIDVTIAADNVSDWSSLTEIKIYMGRERPTYLPYDLLQDSARTWIIYGRESNDIEVDELQLSGNGNLAFASNDSTSTHFKARNLVGDQTGTIHVGPHQNVTIFSAPNSIIATSLYAYQVHSSYFIFMCLVFMWKFPSEKILG